MIRGISRPPIPARVALLIGLFWFVSLDNNPVVRLEAVLGLSPSPIETIFGIKSLFSGMTEAMHRLSQFDLTGAIQANVLTPFACVAAIYSILVWTVPRIRDRRDEVTFFALAAGLSVPVNLLN